MQPGVSSLKQIRSEPKSTPRFQLADLCSFPTDTDSSVGVTWGHLSDMI